MRIDRACGSRWSKGWVASVRDNDLLSRHARWIVNDLLDDLKYTDGKIVKAGQRLCEATEGDAVIEKLAEQQGIGEVTAWVLRAYVGDFGRFKAARRLARYCGLSPCNASGGRRGADRRVQQAAAADGRAGGASPDLHHRPLGETGRFDAVARQAGVRDRRRRRQPLAQEPASCDEAAGNPTGGGVDELKRSRGEEGPRRFWRTRRFWRIGRSAVVRANELVALLGLTGASPPTQGSSRD